jgi:hypothetical protein
MAMPAGIIGPINLGNPSEFTMLELATMVTDLTGSRSQVVLKLRHDAVVKGGSQDEVDRQLVLLEQCFEFLPRLPIAGHNRRHMFANLRHQTPIQRARDAGVQDPRLDHAWQHGMQDANFHLP